MHDKMFVPSTHKKPLGGSAAQIIPCCWNWTMACEVRSPGVHCSITAERLMESTSVVTFEQVARGFQQLTFVTNAHTHDRGDGAQSARHSECEPNVGQLHR